MELIKKESNKLFISNYVGEAKFELENGESFTYELMTTMSMSPIIKFPNGDIVIVNWEDIIKVVQEYKKKVEEEKND